MGTKFLPDDVSIVRLAVEGNAYQAKLWRLATGRWKLLSVELGERLSVPGSGREGTCLDVLLEAEDVARAHFLGLAPR